ncbi:hypothetical protein HDU76_004584 [Blyttiomyces sp. JEL0837]|nr:hypothetical protein HDU76_004584 [Blyttiomyces sp. JEL0837]
MPSTPESATFYNTNMNMSSGDMIDTNTNPFSLAIDDSSSAPPLPQQPPSRTNTSSSSTSSSFSNPSRHLTGNNNTVTSNTSNTSSATKRANINLAKFAVSITDVAKKIAGAMNSNSNPSLNEVNSSSSSSLGDHPSSTKTATTPNQSGTNGSGPSGSGGLFSFGSKPVETRKGAGPMRDVQTMEGSLVFTLRRNGNAAIFFNRSITELAYQVFYPIDAFGIWKIQIRNGYEGPLLFTIRKELFAWDFTLEHAPIAVAGSDSRFPGPGQTLTSNNPDSTPTPTSTSNHNTNTFNHSNSNSQIFSVAVPEASLSQQQQLQHQQGPLSSGFTHLTKLGAPYSAKLVASTLKGFREHFFRAWDGREFKWQANGIGNKLKCVDARDGSVVAIIHRDKASYRSEGVFEIFPPTGFTLEEWEREHGDPYV